MNAQFVTLLAQAPGQAPGGSGMTQFALFILIIGLAFYFLILRPQKKEQSEREKLLSALSRGDKVITAGGIHGTVSSIADKDTVDVEIAKNVRVTFNRSAISVINPGKKSEEKDKAAEAKEEKAGKK